MCVCVCVCVNVENEKVRKLLQFIFFHIHSEYINTCVTLVPDFSVVFGRLSSRLYVENFITGGHRYF